MSNKSVPFELGMSPPPGVAFVQWADGSIRIRYSTRDVVPLREMLLNLARGLTEQAIRKLQVEREQEIERQKMPLSKLESITRELHQLESQTIELDPVDLSQLDSEHETH